MKHTFFLIVLTLGMCSINTSAQTKQPVRKTAQTKPQTKLIPKDSREYQVGKDGFEWYKVCKNGKYGVEDRNGRMIIPYEYKEVKYYDWLQQYDVPGFFYVYTDKQGMGEGVYSKKGECIIPISRNYHFILIHISFKDEVGVIFQYSINSPEGNTGVCNIKGEKVFEAQCHYADIQPHYKNGKFYFEVGIFEKKWRHGIIDGNGTIIVPIEYESLRASESDGCFYFRDSVNQKDIIVGKFSDIGTSNNILADNIRLTASICSSSSNYSLSSNSDQLSSSNSSNSNNTGGTSTIVVEHHRDPIPVQEWQACFACGGMGTMGCHSCGGSGTKYIGDRLHRCGLCNGRGIIPCNVCFGNKGQYITVYK